MGAADTPHSDKTTTVEHRLCLHFNLNTLFTPRGFRASNLAPLCQRFNPARPVVEKAKRMKAVAHFPHTVAVRQKRYPLPRKQRACMYHPSAPFDFPALPYAADDRLAIVFVWHDAPGVCARRRSVQGRWHHAAILKGKQEGVNVERSFALDKIWSDTLHTAKGGIAQAGLMVSETVTKEQADFLAALNKDLLAAVDWVANNGKSAAEIAANYMPAPVPALGRVYNSLIAAARP